MRMAQFRVQNYKKIRDSGWISTGDLTAFVGKNEAGKSSVFRALSKLNPSDEERYDGLKEFPRRRFASEFKTQDWPVASVQFKLDEAERKKLTEDRSNSQRRDSRHLHSALFMESRRGV